jgi:hypothetical protein
MGCGFSLRLHRLGLFCSTLTAWAPPRDWGMIEIRIWTNPEFFRKFRLPVFIENSHTEFVTSATGHDRLYSQWASLVFISVRISVDSKITVWSKGLSK